MITRTDALGREFTFAAPPRRVVSLVPSLTETLFAIGAGSAVAGATSFCIFPEGELRDTPRVGGTKNPNIDRIRELAPELVYVNLEENLRQHADAIAEFAPLFATEPKSVTDASALVRTLGSIHAANEQAEALALAIDNEAAALRDISGRFTFACPIWKAPWMWCGGDTYVSALVETAGGVNVFAGENRYPEHALESVRQLQPDVIFLPDEPYAFTADDAAQLKLESARVIGPFPGHLFTWHGARTLDGLRFLRSALHG